MKEEKDCKLDDCGLFVTCNNCKKQEIKKAKQDALRDLLEKLKKPLPKGVTVEKFIEKELDEA